MRKITARGLLRVLFAAYCGVMLWLLFGRSSHDSGYGYWHSLLSNINLVPFQTTADLVRNLICPPTPGLFTYAWVNLFGNVVVFIPLGIYLPMLWPKLQQWKQFFCVSSGIILAIELLQLFTLRGILDVDDYILNILGLFMGFLFFHLCTRRRSDELI